MNAKKKKPGPPSSKTAAKVAQICKLLEAGKPTRVVCRTVGISSSTYYQWLKHDDALTWKMASAAESVTRKAIENIVAMIEDGDAHKSMWWLERRAPEFRQIKAAENPILDGVEDLDEQDREKIRTIIVSGLARKKKAER